MQIANLVPKIFRAHLPSLRSACKALAVCTVDFQNEVKKKGATIDVPVPIASGTADVVPGVSPPANTDKTPTTKKIDLSNWKRSDKIAITAKERAEFDAGEYQGSQLLEQTIAVVEKISLDCLTGMKDASWRRSGTAGTNPYATTDADTIDVRKILGQAKAPRNDRHLILGPTAAARALAISSIKDASLRGNTTTKDEGDIGRYMGIQHWEDQQVVSHTKGTAAGALTLGTTIPTAGTIGSLNLKAATPGTIKKGDLLAVVTAGVTYNYVATADVASVDTTAAGIPVPVYPAIQATHVAGDTWTLQASHSANIALQRGAYGLAMRPIDTKDLGIGEHVQITDPETGLSLIYSMIPEYMQWSMQVSAIYGHGSLRDDWLVRLMGDPLAA